MPSLQTSLSNSPKILIVEDDADIRELCRDQIRKEGFGVEAVTNGQEAIAFLDTHKEPCLILLDMMMPIMNRREFMSAFSDRPHTIVPIPVYLVSATANGKDGQDIGCYGFLKKPVDVDALISIVRNHCKMSAHASLAPASISASHKIPDHLSL